MFTGGKIQYGDFSERGDEFILERPDTPRPWLNLLTNGRYSSLVSHTGEGSAAVIHDGRAVPVTHPAKQKFGSTPNGRYVYIRDNDSEEVWSLTWQPVRQRTDKFKASYGLGYVGVETSYYGIDSALTVFVPESDLCEIWQTKLINATRRKRRLSIFTFVRWPDGSVLPGNETFYRDGVIYAGNRQEPGLVRFAASDRRPDSFDCDAERFYGINSAMPQAVAEGKCSRTESAGTPAVGVLQHNITLGPQAEFSFNTIIGIGVASPETHQTASLQKAEAVRHIKNLVKKYTQPSTVTSAYETCRKNIWERVSRSKTSSPEKTVNNFQNFWAPYQAWQLARSPIRFSHRGWTRPTTEEVSRLSAAVSNLDTDFALSNIAELFINQTKEGRLAEKNESILWPVIALIQVVKETGNLQCLKTELPYYDGGKGTLGEHFIKALEWSVRDRNVKHLIEVRGEESLESTALVYSALKDALPILDEIGEHELVHKYQHVLIQTRESAEKRLWDGGWFRSTSRRGTKTAKFHRIDRAAQAWAVKTQLCEAKRGRKALDAANKALLTAGGGLELSPPYTQADPQYPASNNVPGTYGNGGIGLETEAAFAIAETILGRGDSAFSIWERISPESSSKKAEYQAEPFLIPSSIFAQPHLNAGRAAYAFTGSAAGDWYRAFLDHIFGIQPTLRGLKINPCLPRDWRHVDLNRTFRGAEYHIRIQNPFRSCGGVDRILVDGRRIAGLVIEPFAGGVHFVEVVLG